MKFPKIKMLTGVLLGLFFTAACDDTIEIPVNFNLGISPKEVTIPAAGGRATVSFTSPFAWETASGADWLKITPASGEAGENIVLTLSATANESTSQRTANLSIKVTDTEFAETVKVIQTGAEPPFVPSLEVSDQSVSFQAAGGEFTVTVTANLDWTAAASSDWLTLSAASGKEGSTGLVLTAAANSSEHARSATVTVTGGGITRTVNVEQAAFVPNISVSPSSLSFGNTGGEKSVSVTANAAWTASASDGWVRISPAQGSGNGTVVVSVPENDVTESRSGSVTFTCGSKTVKLTVSQSSATLTEITGVKATLQDWADGGEIVIPSGSQSQATETEWSVYLPNEDMVIAMEKGADGLFTAQIPNHYPTMPVFFLKDGKEIFGSVYYSAYIPGEEGTYTVPLILTTSSAHAAYVPWDGPVDVTIYPATLTATFVEVPVPWEYFGKGMFTDGFITYAWDLEMEEMEVEIEKRKDAQEYRIRNPYAALCEAYPEMFDYDPDNAELIVVLKEDGTAYFKETCTGISAGSYGMVWVMSIVPETGFSSYDYYGTWDRATVTVVFDKRAAIYLPEDGGYYFTNGDGRMKITLSAAN